MKQTKKQNNFILEYKKKLFSILDSLDLDNKILKTVKILKNCKKQKSKVILFGNGASASIANHVSVDLTKNSKISSLNFNESNLITCFSNDYGYENWMQKALEFHSNSGDVVILISSSGESKNIVKAAKWCKKNKIKLISLSGHKKNNQLNKINKNGVSFWINSESYNHIELSHLYILLLVVDIIVGKTDYKIN